MTTRQMIVLGAAACVLAVGCQNSPKRNLPTAIPSSEQQPADAQSRPNGKPKVDQMDASAGSIEALTWKTESYAKEIAPLVQARTSSQPARASARAQAAPSAVEWLDPSEFRLGGKPADSAVLAADRAGQTADKPGIATSPAGGNQPGSADFRSNTKAAGNTAVAIADTISRVPSPLRSGSSQTSDALAQKLSSRVKDYPRDVAAQLEYQLLQFLMDEPTPQMSVLASLPSEDRELVSAFMDGLTNLRNALRADNNMLLSRKIKSILDMADRLRSQAELTIPTVALCKSVANFGIYEPIEPARFTAGQDQQVIVYCEVANFATNLNDKQSWETRLTWDMTLYTAEMGMAVWSDKTETITDSSRNRRHDFFVRKLITLPHTLTIGRYLLKVSLVDTQANRVAEATLPLVIAAQ